MNKPEPLADVEEYERVDYWLNQWARWMRGRGNRLGYPTKAHPFIGGGESRRTDEWEEDEMESIWKTNCKVMDALIDSLPPAQGCAVHTVYLGSTFRFDQRVGGDPISLLGKAMERLLVGMKERVVL